MKRDPLNWPQVGVVEDMSFADYLAVPAMSNSGLKLMRKSPAHYLAGFDPDAEQKPSLRRGSLLHTLVLEPQTLSQRYRIKPDGMNFATKEGKAWRDETPSDVEIVTTPEFKAATRQANNLRAVPEIAALLDEGTSEVSFFWIDPATGVQCKGRLDWRHPAGSGVILMDLKTTESAEPDAFARACGRYGYHMQDAWYCDGWNLATGENVLGFLFGAVESVWPHVAAPYMLDDDSIERGRAECRRLLNLYAHCKATNVWPGYVESVTPLTLPPWA